MGSTAVRGREKERRRGDSMKFVRFAPMVVLVLTALCAEASTGAAALATRGKVGELKRAIMPDNMLLTKEQTANVVDSYNKQLQQISLIVEPVAGGNAPPVAMIEHPVQPSTLLVSPAVMDIDKVALNSDDRQFKPKTGSSKPLSSVPTLGTTAAGASNNKGKLSLPPLGPGAASSSEAYVAKTEPAPALKGGQGLPATASSAAAAVTAAEGYKLDRRRILIAVESAPEHFNARDAIRESWGEESNLAKHDVDLRFFIGELKPGMGDVEERIGKESRVQRLTGFIEGYYNLTAKSLGLYVWGHDHGYANVFKVDDDTFVRVDLLRGWADSLDDKSVGGMIVRDVVVNKNPTSKWYLADQYDQEKLPPYAIGAGVFLTGSPLKYIAERRQELKLYRVEDVSVGIWLKDQGYNFISMSADVYSYHIKPDSVIINPCNHNEMVKLQHSPAGEGITLQACEETCLCQGSPKWHPDCFESFGNEEYKDIIPRMAHTQL